MSTRPRLLRLKGCMQICASTETPLIEDRQTTGGLEVLIDSRLAIGAEIAARPLAQLGRPKQRQRQLAEGRLRPNPASLEDTTEPEVRGGGSR